MRDARNDRIDGLLDETERLERENADLRRQVSNYQAARAEIERDLSGANGAVRSACLDDRMAAMVVVCADLRRQLAEAHGEAQRTVYVPETEGETVALERAVEYGVAKVGRESPEKCRKAWPGYDAIAVTLTARKVGK